MTKEKFKRHLIQMFVDNGVALNLLSSPAFVGLNGEMAEKLGVSLRSHSIRNMILYEAEKQKKLKEELHDKSKMDACTRHRVNYFALNAQFVDSKNELTIITMAIRDTDNQHSSTFIQTLVEDVLRDVEKQVLAVVADNASNMTLAVKKLSEDSVVDENEAESEQEGTSTLDETIASAFTDYTQEFSTMSHMRCAAHTLQLATRDGLKINSVASLIIRIRRVVVAARTPKIDAIFKRKVYKGAILDQATRWGSTYLMIERLLELKDTLVDIAHPDVSLPEVQWNEIKGLESTLRHPFLFTKKLQAAI